MSPTTPTAWIKATASDGANNCVELRRNGDTVEMRDSKNPEGPILRFTGGELSAFVDGAGKGEFNHLLEDLA